MLPPKFYANLPAIVEITYIISISKGELSPDYLCILTSNNN